MKIKNANTNEWYTLHMYDIIKPGDVVQFKSDVLESICSDDYLNTVTIVANKEIPSGIVVLPDNDFLKLKFEVIDVTDLIATISINTPSKTIRYKIPVEFLQIVLINEHKRKPIFTSCEPTKSSSNNFYNLEYQSNKFIIINLLQIISLEIIEWSTSDYLVSNKAHLILSDGRHFTLVKDEYLKLIDKLGINI